jgi:hypothetical protein
MNIEGLWTVQFSKTEEFYENLQIGENINRGGTIILTNNKVLGGGISYYFTGSFESGNSTISMNITATRYNDLVSGVFGDDTTGSMTLTGIVNDNVMKLHGCLENDESKMIFIEAHKRAEI